MEKSFHYVETKKPFLFLEDLRTKTYGGTVIVELPIIWNLSGLYKLITLEQIKNLIGLRKDLDNSPNLNPKPNLGFHWDEGVDLDTKIVKLLIGQQ